VLGAMIERSLQSVVVRAQIAVPGPRIGAASEPGKQWPARSSAAWSCRVNLEISEAAYRLGAHVTHGSREVPKPLPLDEEVPRLNVASIQLLAINKPHGRSGWQWYESRIYVRRRYIGDALLERLERLKAVC